MTEEERAYNSEEFTAVFTPANTPKATMPAKVGFDAPEFEASALDGKVIRLNELRGKRHVVMMSGAVTSPMCAYEVPAFNLLQEEFASRDVSFFLLYTRESHPAENYAAHQSLEQKISYARDLQRLENVRLPIIVDHLDGRIHRAYGAWPNALYVIHKDGRLILRSNMANDRELRQFLDDLLETEKAAADGKVTHLQYSERIVPHVADQATHRRIYERAGPKAFEDYWARRPHNRNRWP
jgi:peroxiredoxin